MRIIIKESGIEYPCKDAPRVRTPEDVVEHCGDIANSDTETFCVLMLDARNRLLCSEIITMGLVSSCLAHPREVFRSAVRNGASAIVLVHNHPSGETSPSAEDLRITRQLVEAGKVLGIGVIDHVIIGQGHGSMSVRENGLVTF